MLSGQPAKRVFFKFGNLLPFKFSKNFWHRSKEGVLLKVLCLVTWTYWASICSIEIIKFRTTPVRTIACEEGTGALAQGDLTKPLAYAQTGMVIDVDGIDVTLVEVVHLGDGW